jgi:general secretion pathway protein A
LMAKSGSQSTAFSALMGLWGTSHGAGNNGCKQAQTYGLRCFYGTGWQELLDYNHPALVSLKEDGKIAYAVVINAADEQAIRIQLDSSQLSVTKTWLLERLTGAFTLLWQPKFSYEKALSVGQRNDGVAQLSQLLNQLYAPGQFSSDVFDQGLRDNVIRFQQENALTVDGIAGEKTLLKLQSMTGSNVKQLRGNQ